MKDCHDCKQKLYQMRIMMDVTARRGERLEGVVRSTLAGVNHSKAPQGDGAAAGTEVKPGDGMEQQHEADPKVFEGPKSEHWEGFYEEIARALVLAGMEPRMVVASRFIA